MANNNPLWIKVEPTAGARIDDCARELVRLATLLSTPIETEFNGTTISADPGDSVHRVLDRYDRERKRDLVSVAI